MNERPVVITGFVTVALLLVTAGCILSGVRRRQPPLSHAAMPVAATPVAALESGDSVAALRNAPRLDIAYAPLIEQAAERHDLPPLLIAAITRVESGFDPHEVSHKGARGLMQVMPETGARFGVHPNLLFDPERNIAAGTAYLSWLLDRYDNDLDLALAGYNAGEGAVDKYRGIPPYRETQQYVRKVRSAYFELQRSATPGG